MIHFIQSELTQIASPERKKAIEFFFKHEIAAYGVNNPDTQKIGRLVIQKLKAEKWTKAQVFDLAEQLFKNKWIEESLLACQIVYAYKKDYIIDDFEIFEAWIKDYIDNWAECDTFCNRTIGEMLLRFPELSEKVKAWALDDNLWARRAAAVSFIYPAKKNLLVEVQWDIALLLLEDTEDMVQKGYGWMLKVLSQQRQKEVFQFVCQYKERMPRTALRYAIEKMPQSMRKEAMAK
ncbi:MAG: DNA alkylation repair protein [Bacteroidetes bacterium]|nr:DNA alkylation repair protein [Bacteroidota bacterium]